MQIGKLPIHSSSHVSSQSRQPQREPGRTETASLQPAPTRKHHSGATMHRGVEGSAGHLGQRVLDPAFTPVASHSGQHAVNTYRSIANEAGPELLNRLDVSA